VFDGNHSLLVFYCPTVFANPVVNVPASVRLFDLNTETWGADEGTTANNYTAVAAAFLRSDGKVAVLLSTSPNSIASPPLIRFSFALWSGGVWSGEIHCDTNLPAPTLNELNAGPGGVLDSHDNLYALLPFNRTSPFASSWNYQLITAGGVLGGFQLDIPVATGSTVSLMQPVIFGTNIVQPARDLGTSRLTFLTSPVGATPAFVASGIFVDPDASRVMTLQSNGNTDGSTAYIAYTDNITKDLRLCQSSDLVTWTAQTAVPAVGGGAQVTFPYPFSKLSITWLGTDPTDFGQATFFSAFSVVTPSTAPFLGGASAGRVRCCPPEKAKQLMRAGEALREMLKGSES
jgi:hypothetical protein